MHRMLESLFDRVLERPWTVLGAALALTVVAVWLGVGIDLRTSRRELSREDDPEESRWDAVTAEFASPEPLIAVLEDTSSRPDTRRLEKTADTLAQRLATLPTVGSVYHRLDFDWMLRVAPWLAPPEQLTAIVEQADGLLAGADGEPVLTTFADLDVRLAEKIDGALRQGAALPADSDAASAERLADLIRAEREFYADPVAFVERLSAPGLLLTGGEGASTTGDGYLATRSGDALFLLIRPGDGDGSLAADRQLVRSVREVGQRTLPDGMRLGLTGRPAMGVEEMDTIARDSRTSSLVAILGVTLLALGAFHHRRHALVALGVLVVGVIWSLGAVELELGYLNMITTALVPILVGIGIDYAVHPVSQFEVERRPGVPLREALREAFRKTGAAVAVSALTTAAAFACFLFMEFRGFAELGLVASVGVLLCLVAALVVLPAALLVVARPAGAGAEPRAVIDRLWNERSAAALCRRPVATVVAGVTITAAAALAATHVGVDTSLVELMPPSAESLHYLNRVADDSALGVYFNLVLRDDPQELRRLREAAEDVPEIARVDEPSRLLPDDPERARAAVARLTGFLRRLRIEEPAAEGGPGPTEALAGLESVLAEAADTAFVTGLGPVAGALERARGQAQEARSAALEGDEAVRRRQESRLRERLRALKTDLLAAAEAGPPELEQMPEAIRSRFVTQAGHLVAYLYPEGDVFDPDFLSRFNAASRRLAADAIGFPVLFEIQSRRITGGFFLALIAGAVVVVLILAADLRRTSHVLLALVPVLTGVIWMIGAMWLLDLSFNFANLVAVPLVLGVGIDAGVHVLHRYRLESDATVERVVEHTGRALLIASLTTMVGFGALGLAHHRGMASLGTLLFLGVGACLVSALALLPAVLRLLEPPRTPDAGRS